MKKTDSFFGEYIFDGDGRERKFIHLSVERVDHDKGVVMIIIDTE